LWLPDGVTDDRTTVSLIYVTADFRAGSGGGAVRYLAGVADKRIGLRGRLTVSPS
jgi:hypothetical protein